MNRTRRVRSKGPECPPPHHRVYVVRLDHYPKARGRECYYVGMTGLPIEQRFANHKRGYKGARIVQLYGIELAHELFDGIPPMPYTRSSVGGADARR